MTPDATAHDGPGGPAGDHPDPAALSEQELIAEAVAACAGVASMSAGPLDQYRSYLPGRSVAGVRTDDERVQISVVARYGPSLPELGEQIAAAVGPLAAGRRVTVSVEDLELPGPPAGER